MFLKRIEIQGFKSFADKTEIDFLSGITTVIGPNGSGKSNIVDAVRWVLGEQSMKSLRGSKSEDIIFSGTQARRSVGFAEVNLVIDNSLGILPIEYDEVLVTRRLYRSGESEYLINKCICRLKDIQQLFLSTGVGKDGYSIIGQGQVEEILSSKSEDRRYLFEEAAGILKYRYRKNEADRKLENTNANLARATDIINEIEGRLDNLYAQSEKAKQYLNFREELKSKEISLFTYNMDKNNNSLNENNEKLNIVLEQVKDEESELEKIQENKAKLKEDIEELIFKSETIQKFKYESDNTIDKLKSEINVLKVQRENNDENFKIFDKEIAELKELIEKNAQDKENRSSKIESLLNNKKKFEEELKIREEEYNEIYSKLNKQGEEVESKKEKLQNIHEEKMNIKMKINEYANQITNNENVLQKIDKEQKEKIYSKDAKNMEKEDIRSICNQYLSKQKECNKIVQEYNNTKNVIADNMKKFDSDIDIVTQEIKNKRSRSIFLTEIQKEKEGYGKAVKEILINSEKDSNFGNGVEGSIADVISVPSEYETAIEMALGGYLQNIVTLSEETAKRCIEFLKENNYGRASFLPISTIKGTKLDGIGKIEKEPGYIGIASDLVKYNSKYEQIILNLLGKTVIIDNLQNAISIARKHGYKYKIVTLQGDILSSFGQLTGGSISKKSSNILGRGKEIEELEKDIKKLEVKLNKLENEKLEYMNSNNVDDEKYIQANSELSDINIQIAVNNQKLESINNDIIAFENRIEYIKKEKEELNSKNEENKLLIDNLENSIIHMEEEYNKLQEEVKEYANKYADEQKNIDNLKDEITDLKISISSFDESNLSYEEMMQVIENEIQKATLNIEKKEQAKEKILKENDDFEQNIYNLEERIKDVIDKKQNVDLDIEKIKEEKEEKNNELNTFDKKIEETLANISLLKNDSIKIENKINKITEEMDALKLRVVEEYEIPLEELTNQSVEELEPNKVQRDINSLKKNIKELGSINIDSIDEYKQNKERYDFLTAQRDDLESTQNQLHKLIQEMTVIMKEQFKCKFKVINENFMEVFEKLFGGGRAELKLTDENDILNCGIEIEAQPPGKKLQNMMLLSGGEKTLTAISLLFGILKSNPSPFCILDEIEAALDDINIFRFTQYVKEYSNKTQFLIITHRKGTMEIANTLYGVTMQEQGISKLISMKV